MRIRPTAGSIATSTQTSEIYCISLSPWRIFESGGAPGTLINGVAGIPYYWEDTYEFGNAPDDEATRTVRNPFYWDRTHESGELPDNKVTRKVGIEAELRRVIRRRWAERGPFSIVMVAVFGPVSTLEPRFNRRNSELYGRFSGIDCDPKWHGVNSVAIIKDELELLAQESQVSMPKVHAILDVNAAAIGEFVHRKMLTGSTERVMVFKACQPSDMSHVFSGHEYQKLMRAESLSNLLLDVDVVARNVPAGATVIDRRRLTDITSTRAIERAWGRNVPFSEIPWAYNTVIGKAAYMSALGIYWAASKLQPDVVVLTGRLSQMKNGGDKFWLTAVTKSLHELANLDATRNRYKPVPAALPEIEVRSVERPVSLGLRHLGATIMRSS